MLTVLVLLLRQAGCMLFIPDRSVRPKLQGLVSILRVPATVMTLSTADLAATAVNAHCQAMHETKNESTSLPAAVPPPTHPCLRLAKANRFFDCFSHA